MNILELDSYSLADAVKFNDQLNPRIWQGQTMRPQVRAKLLEIAADFQQFLGVPDLDVRDITVSGSNAGYTYTDHSDIDLHLVVAMPEQCDEVYQELFNAKKYQYNDEHDIRIGGYDVELYVQPADQPHVSAGVYSVMNNDWIHIPRKLRADVDDAGVKNKYEDVKARVEAAVKSSDIDRMQKLWDKIKDMRRAGLAANGELGPENLAFKILRTQGVIGGLKDAIAQERDRELSLTERRKKKKKVRYGFGGYWYPGFAFGTGSDAVSDNGGGDGGGEARIQEVGLSPDGVSPETKMFLSEKPAPTHEEIIRDFFQYAVEQLGIENIPGLKLKKDPQWSIRNQSFGRYDNATGNIDLAVGNRHIMDVLRTLAHELMHRKQDERDQLPPGAGETGSPYENEAHVIAGILMRNYADLHPEYFEDVPVSESASGYIPTQKQARDPRYAMALTVDIKPGEVGRQANKMALKTDSQGRPGLLMKTANLREGRAYDGNDPPGPETPPTMPQGTVRVDVSDVYDWYKLGQHIANLKGLGHHDFGAGPPSTIVSFGDEDTEHKFIKNLQATGLDVTDIDPRDPKQPPGMRKIKTDPTYNVDESAGNPLVDLTPNYPNYRKLIGEFIGINKNQRALFKIIDIELIPGQGPTEKIEQAKLTGRPISIEMQRIRNRKVVDQGMAEGQVYDFRPNQLIDVFYDPSTVTNSATSQKVATIPYRNLDRLTALLKQKHGIDATKLRWSAAKPNNSQDVTEAFDRPYPLKWSKSEHGDYDALARLSDGSPLSISFEHVTPYEVAVSFTRGHSLDVTGAGDAQRVFATVLAAIQQFLKKEQPANISFSASKEGEEGESTESRAKLYNRLVDRYATQWGYSVRVFDQGSQVEYELYRGFEPPFESQGVARSLNEFAPGGDEGNSPYAYAIALKEMARLYAEGAFDYDLAPGSKAQNESDAEDISQVADAFMNQGMEAGREAYNMVDTGVRDEMDSYLKDQGFNVQNDIHAEYQKDVERYRNSPQGRAQAQAQAAKDAEYAKGAAARKANEVVISAMDATTGEEEFSKISFDRGSFSPEQLRAKIQRSVAELKQHFVDYPGRNPSEKIIKVTIGGKPVDIDQGVAEAVHPDVTSKKYFLDPTQNVKMGDFVFNARTFTGGLADPNARGLQIRAYDPKDMTSSIGSADFVVKSDPKGRQWLESDDTEVDELYRGQGVAAMMYAFAKSLGNDIKDSAYKSKAGSDMWAKWGPDAKNLAKEQDDLVESLRREFELLENEVLGEIKMSPKNLRAEAAKTGAVAGMEFEMIVPNVSGLDDYRESEPDWDADESVRDIDDACNFFYDGDFNSRRDIEGLREEMTEQYYEWLDERKKERWEDESADYIRDWLWRTYEDDWREEAQKEIVDQAPEFGVNDEELRQRVEDFVNEKWEAATEDVLANMGSDWDQAYDEWSEDFNDNADMEDEWLSDQGWTTMKDILDNFDIQWPHYYTPDSDGADVNAVADDFSDAVGMPVNASTSYHGGRREPGHYVVEPDSSLEPNDSDDQGLEFVSPPMPIDELMDQLNKVKKWAGRYGCYTNESTGLHINISVPDYDLARLDYVKLALLMGDEYVLDQFGRSSNTYTKSAMGKIRDILRQRPEAAEQVLDRMKGHMADLATKAIHSGSTDKYTSINTKNGYIEFRSPGGDWLDANFDKVENTLLRFTVALSAAMDPQAYRQEYLKKLYKLLSPKNEDDPISYFAKYSAGELPKAALRSFVKQVQLQRRIKRDPTGGQKYWWLVERPGYGASVEVVAASREEAIALGKKEYPEWDYSKDMTAKPLRPYDDSPVKATLGEPQPAGGMRPTNPDGNYVIFANNTRAGDPPAYRFMAADGDDAGIVLRQYSRVNPGDWEVHYDPNQRLGQPPVPGSTLDLQRRRAAAATRDIINPLYQNVPIPGVTDVELDIPMAEPRPLGVGREFAGWKVLLPSGEEVYRFSGVGNSQSDANRIAADWLRNNGMGVSGEGYEVVPVWREA